MTSLLRVAIAASLLLSSAALAQPAPPPAEPPAPTPPPAEPPAPTPPTTPIDEVPAPMPPTPPMEAPAPAPEAPDAGTVHYKDGFVLTAGDDHAATLNLRVQGRYELLSLDEGDARGEESAFSIARARLGVKGHVYDPRLKYKFQADLGKGFVSLKDFIVDWELAPGAVVRVGQFKRPLSRQQINSSGDLELVDRAITDKFFGNGRDIGLALHNDYEKSPDLEYVVGVFNGTGETPRFDGDVVVDPMTGEGAVDDGAKFSNVPAMFGPMFIARVGLNRGGIKGYKEADLEGGPLRFAVAATTLAELDADGDDASSTRHGVDGVVKVSGLSATGGAWIATAQDGAGFADQAYAATGFFAQVGGMVTARLQPALRYAYVNPDGGGNDLQELTAGLSLYQFKHGFKWQTDVSWLATGSGDARVDDLRARTQLQLAF